MWTIRIRHKLKGSPEEFRMLQLKVRDLDLLTVQVHRAHETHNILLLITLLNKIQALQSKRQQWSQPQFHSQSCWNHSIQQTRLTMKHSRSTWSCCCRILRRGSRRWKVNCARRTCSSRLMATHRARTGRWSRRGPARRLKSRMKQDKSNRLKKFCPRQIRRHRNPNQSSKQTLRCNRLLTSLRVVVRTIRVHLFKTPNRHQLLLLRSTMRVMQQSARFLITRKANRSH